MNNLFDTGKAILKEQIKKKILIYLAPAIPWIIGVMAGLILILMALGPIIGALQAIEDFTGKVTGFFENVGTRTTNLFAGRGFIVITQEKIEEKENEFNLELRDIYKKFKRKVTIDAPLVLATVYYPLNVSYDENIFACLNLDKSFYASDEDYESVKQKCKDRGFVTGKEEQYDYYTEKKVKMYELVAKMIELTTNEYECVAQDVEIEGEKTTIYIQGDLIGSKTEPLKEDAYKHVIMDDSYCSGPSSMFTYKYSLNIDNYDEYLKNEYIPVSREFGLDSFSSEDQPKRIVQIVYGIHDLTDYYYYIFESTLSEFAMLYGSIPADIVKQMVVPVDARTGSDGKGNYMISSCFGPRTLSYQSESTLHTGIDITGMRGGDLGIRAIADGTVVKIVDKYLPSFNCYGTCNGPEAAGNYINIKHDFNGVTYTSRYLHLSSIEPGLKEGDVVTKGSKIGVMGNTGNSSGAHLHFEVRDSDYNPINPGNLFTNPYEINAKSNCSILAYDCANKSSPLVVSPLYAKWKNLTYPIFVKVNNITMPLEQYVLGVTLNESWPHYHVEALKAQAVTARTYTFGGGRYNSFKLENAQIVIDMGVASEATQTFNLNRLCEISTTYQSNFLQAIEMTRGQVLTNLTTDRMFSSEYSSCADNNGYSTYGNGYVHKLPGNVQKVQAFCSSTKCNQNGRNVCGHGRGMSQTGSNFLATNQGYNYVRIINHYYDANIVNLGAIDLSIYER